MATTQAGALGGAADTVPSGRPDVVGPLPSVADGGGRVRPEGLPRVLPPWPVRR
ncbi:hypothetical protein [Streptomyces sp. NPDC058683]|uniref:hypothetical protein n=1 Tax=Streptomyces sp. NPDC058683 TaxID=3346597 RepID=UPI003652F01A